MKTKANRNRFPGLAATLALLAGAPLTQPARAQTPVSPAYTVIDLGTLGGTNSKATAINNSGQIIGGSNISDEVSPYQTHAALFTPGGSSIDLGTLGGQNSYAYAINNAGQIVGVADVPPFSGNTRAAVFNPGGSPVDLGTLGGSYSYAYTINGAGQIAGSAYISGDSDLRAALFSTSGSATSLGTLGGSFSEAFGNNNASQIVGYSTLPGDGSQHATLFNTDGSRTDLGTLGGKYSGAYSINDAGQIVGYATKLFDTAWHAASFTPGGSPVDLGTLGGSYSYAYSINNAGQIVGYSATNHGPDHAFIVSGGVMVDLNSVVEPGSGVTDINMANVYGQHINDWGQIAAQGSVGGDGATHAVLLNPVNPLTTNSGTSRNTKFVSGMNYNKFTATTDSGGRGTTVTLLGGTAGSGGSVAFADGGHGLNRDMNVVFTGSNSVGLASDIVNLSGTFSDMIVLSLTYDESLLGDDVFLGWRDPASGQWTLAINGNTGEGNTPTFIEGAYDPDSDFILGYYGVDSATHTVWAVVNHNSDFAAMQPVPEPGTWGLVGLGLGGIAIRFLQRRKKTAQAA